MNSRDASAKFLTGKVVDRLGQRSEWTQVSTDSSTSRNQTFYIPKRWVILWNAFISYMVNQKQHRLGEAILVAVLHYLYHLDDTDEQAFRVALQRVVEDAADEVSDVADFASQVLREGESIQQILDSRPDGANNRRRQLIKDSMDWFGPGEFEKLIRDLPHLIDSPT